MEHPPHAPKCLHTGAVSIGEFSTTSSNFTSAFSLLAFLTTAFTF